MSSSTLEYSISQLSPTNPSEVLKTINNLKKKSAVGHDKISANVCVFLQDSLNGKITNLINDCLRNGFFPDNLKIAKVTPIHKGGNKLSVQNYRPISILPVFSKIIERIICNRLITYLSNNTIINKNQFGFCTQSNTLAAVTQLVTSIKSNLDLNMFTSCMFIDLRKAFDSVDHKIMEYKLQNIGMGGMALKLFANYLCNRKQFVEIGGSRSAMKIIKDGVPQGSILGPILFNIFCNDIFNENLYGELIMYADDMALVYKSTHLNDLKSKMQSDIIQIDQWMARNKLAINEDKTKYIIFQTKNKTVDDVDFVLQVKNKNIEKLETYKYLGIWIDNKLNWHRHVDTVKEKIRKTNFILYQMRYTLPTKIKFLIYHTHILGTVRYLLPIYGTAATTKLHEIHVLINKSLKNINNLPHLAPTISLYNSNILNLNDLIKFEIIFLIYKIKNNLIKNNFLFRLIRSIHAYNTRRADNFYIEYSRTSGGQSNPITMGLNLFNNLPEDLKSEYKISAFKKKLKLHLSNN